MIYSGTPDPIPETPADRVVQFGLALVASLAVLSPTIWMLVQ